MQLHLLVEAISQNISVERHELIVEKYQAAYEK